MEYVAIAHQPELDRRRKVAVIGLAFCAATPVLLIIVGRFSLKEGFDGDLARYHRITQMLYGGTILLGLCIIALRRLGMLWVRRTKAEASSKLAKLQTLTLVTVTLGEIIGILGFIAFFITGDFQFCWRLGVVSFAIILWCYPHRAEWTRALAGVNE
jgi:hypothetical protein